MPAVTFTCLTTKKTFEVEDPPVVQLANGRYAYKVPCPWTGKNGRALTAFKFAPKTAWDEQAARQVQVEEKAEEPQPTTSDTEGSSYSEGEDPRV